MSTGFFFRIDSGWTIFLAGVTVDGFEAAASSDLAPLITGRNQSAHATLGMAGP